MIQLNSIYDVTDKFVKYNLYVKETDVKLGHSVSLKLHLLRLRLTQKILQLPSWFFSFPFRHFFWTDCQKLFSERFITSSQESV